MPRVRPFNLFVYGTLMSPSVFRAVLGKRMVFVSSEADNVESFYARDAVLSNYKKITPDGTYLYAVPDPQGRIRGYVLGPLPGECMAGLRQYEGRNYSKRTVEVQTREGSVGAVSFVANLQQLEHSFGFAFRDPLKQEILLEARSRPPWAGSPIPRRMTASATCRGGRWTSSGAGRRRTPARASASRPRSRS